MDHADQELLVMQNEVQDGMTVLTGGVISEVKKMFTKNGNKPMAILRVEDLHGSYDVMVFNKFYEEYKDNLVEDAIVVITGRLSIREGDRPIIILDGIQFVEQEGQEIQEEQVKTKKIVFNEQYKEPEKKKKLYMQFNIQNEKLKEQIFEVLESYPGKIETFVQFERKIYSRRKQTVIKQK